MKTKNFISLKTPAELKILGEAGRILASIVRELKSSLKIGITTKEVDGLAEKLMERHKVIAAFKGYKGFPSTVCISVNEEVVHGIPSDRVLQDGDIVSLDVGIVHNGYYSDMAVSKGIGNISPQSQKLIDVTQQSLVKGIEQARVDQRLFDISHAVQKFVEAHGFSVVREFVGHGIGRKLHEDPEIPNFGEPHKGPVLKEGMIFAIEPMVNAGTWKTRILSDGWTVVTQDGKPSAHFEHTIAITGNGPVVLTE